MMLFVLRVKVQSEEGRTPRKEINDMRSLLVCVLWTWALKVLIGVFSSHQSFNQPFTFDQ